MNEEWRVFLIRLMGHMAGELMAVTCCNSSQKQPGIDKFNKAALALGRRKRFFYWHAALWFLRFVWLVRKMECTGQPMPPARRDRYRGPSPLDDNNGRRPEPLCNTADPDDMGD